MDEADWLAARFEEQRAHLRAVAYRMLGSLAEADDAVQNSWLRLSRADPAGVENLAGWLTTVVARECLKMMRARRSRREEPLAADFSAGPPAGPHDASDPEAEALLADSVGPALMVVLDTLGAGRAPGFRPARHLRRAVRRDRRHPRTLPGRVPAARQPRPQAGPGRHAAPDADPGRQRQIVDAFLAALRNGDFEALVAVLDPEVLLRDDSAGLPGGAAEMRGARPWAATRSASRGAPSSSNPLWWTAPWVSPSSPGTDHGGARLHLLRRQDHRDRHGLRTRPPPGGQPGRCGSLTRTAGARWRWR